MLASNKILIVRLLVKQLLKTLCVWSLEKLVQKLKSFLKKSLDKPLNKLVMILQNLEWTTKLLSLFLLLINKVQILLKEFISIEMNYKWELEIKD